MVDEDGRAIAARAARPGAPSATPRRWKPMRQRDLAIALRADRQRFEREQASPVDLPDERIIVAYERFRPSHTDIRVDVDDRGRVVVRARARDGRLLVQEVQVTNGFITFTPAAGGT